MTTPRAGKPIRLNVQSSFRVFLYLGFALCVTSTIAILGWGGSWVAPMFGTLAFGIPAVIAYLTEQEHAQNREARAEAQRHRGDAGGDWDLSDDDDPTVPPQKMRNR